ncbi:dynamin-related protein [Pseudoscourfieldia marina]
MRTLAVLTKPDLVDPGSENEMIEVLMNRRMSLMLGFFDGQLGIPNLITRLSDTLSNRIREQFPTIKAEVTNALAKAEADLTSMAEPVASTHEATQRFVSIVQKYRTTVADAAAAKYTSDTLRELDDNDDKSEDVVRLYTRVWRACIKMEAEIRKSKPDFRSDEMIKQYANAIKRKRGPSLPGFLDFSVFSSLMSELIACWNQPCRDLLDTVCDYVQQACETIAASVVPTTYMELLNVFQEAVADVVRDFKKELGPKIRELMEREHATYYTQNHYYMDTVNKIRLDRFQAKLREGHANVTNVESVSKIYMSMHGIGNESNEMQDAADMNILAEAYWKVASKRYIDNVSMVMMNDILGQLPNRIESRLMEVVVGGEIMTFFAQSAADVSRRKRLEEKIVRLKKASQTLRSCLLGEGGV